MNLGDNVEVGGFVVSRVYMKKHKTRAAFNVHVRWKKEGEKEKFVLVGYLTADKKADLAAVRALCWRLQPTRRTTRGKGNSNSKRKRRTTTAALSSATQARKRRAEGACVVLFLYY